jgi:hypothetical protein
VSAGAEGFHTLLDQLENLARARNFAGALGESSVGPRDVQRPRKVAFFHGCLLHLFEVGEFVAEPDDLDIDEFSGLDEFVEHTGSNAAFGCLGMSGELGCVAGGFAQDFVGADDDAKGPFITTVVGVMLAGLFAVSLADLVKRGIPRETKNDVRIDFNAVEHGRCDQFSGDKSVALETAWDPQTF